MTHNEEHTTPRTPSINHGTPHKKKRRVSITLAISGLVVIGGLVGATYLTSYKGLELAEYTERDISVQMPKEFHRTSDSSGDDNNIRDEFYRATDAEESNRAKITVTRLDSYATWGTTQDKAIAEADASKDMDVSFSRHPAFNSDVSSHKIGAITRNKLTVSGFPARKYSFDIMTKSGERIEKAYFLYVFGNTTFYSIEIVAPLNEPKLEQSIDRIFGSVRIEK